MAKDDKQQRAKVALRRAAEAWAKGLAAPVVDFRDQGFRKLDARLMRAARALGRGR